MLRYPLSYFDLAARRRPTLFASHIVQACFDANTGRYSSCTTLSRASGTPEGDWTAVGLLMTKTHIVVTGSDGSIEWLSLPTQTGGSPEVCSTLRGLQKYLEEPNHVTPHPWPTVSSQ